LALEKCNIFTKNGEWWKQGESFYGGTARPAGKRNAAQIPACHRSLDRQDRLGA
jgi:hypothetical protein